ncbi:hypothetical protein FSZ31_12400 [Sphingorhabdus soli]|uniref:DUF4398 domain-containing protein n=1 Tax=Flavisphingopyxis soli TaxID=2601267 RepID=A0A5C6U4L2_9SPHN|nr:hypothetical protein [Sphingorhabdus soli]TXC67769.1 hypothetical protein FSZ31_12400 [Sphingorhabdus soli]
MTARLRLVTILLPVVLSACGANDNDPGPGGVTVGEAKALDEAAEMLEKRGRSPADANAEQAERLRQAQAQNGSDVHAPE